MGKSPMNVVVLLGVGEGRAGMAGTDRAPVLLLPDGRFVTDGESSAVARHAISAQLWRVWPRGSLSVGAYRTGRSVRCRDLCLSPPVAAARTDSATCR
jgi:hypothetical protein